jgi:hypothetical protein
MRPKARVLSWRSLVRTGATSAALLAVLPIGCRSREQSAAPAPRASASAALSSGPAVRCRETSESNVVVLGSGEAPKELEHDEEQAEELPFSVELGQARSGDGRFAVAGLENRRGATFAFAAFVAEDGTGQNVELLRVFGDAEPPAVTPSGEGFLIAAASSDAGGPTLRLLRVDPPFSARDVRRGEELSGLRRDVAGFALENAGNRVLLAFGKIEKGVGRVAVVGIDPDRLAFVGAPRELELPEGLEAESPRLVRRQGGFYLAFVGRPSLPVRPRPAPVPSSNLDNEAPVVESGPSGLYLLPLDEAGAAAGSPREISPTGAQVTAFELARWGDDRALLVYREAPEGPGRERPNVEAALVAPDGAIARRSWELGETAGLPSLLLDPARPNGAPAGWVLVHGEADVRLGALGDDPLAPPTLVSDPVLRSCEPVALSRGSLLRARSRGLKVELDLARCELLAR